MSDDLGSAEIAELLASAGCHEPVTLERLAGGGNNRVYRARSTNFDAVLKAYFHHPDDPRDRLRSEFAFSQLAWDAGLRCLPRPLACDARRHLGLYEFVPGRRLEPHEVDADAVRQASRFVVELNHHKHSNAADALPIAAEACFSIDAHCHCVTRRLERLDKLDLVSSGTTDADLDQAAGLLVRNVLQPKWAELLDQLRRRCAVLGLGWSQEIDPTDYCLSPSDFGFHNALATADGLKFIDFEYAGWDDPAKLACDFFCQPALPVAHEHLPEFIATTTAALSDPALHAARIELLLPAYQMKWCCILLNEFLPVDGRRRQLATSTGAQTDVERRARKQLQLAKVERMLTSLDAVLAGASHRSQPGLRSAVESVA
ncbi:MAG: aminoglycoside phosphotransferase family protein [Pirellula sp.]|nr:aminoglycoside phosphotransferase family protein [Pirellula sp.]